MIKAKKALITGVSGQDGSYLAEYLHSKGYNVHGVDKTFASLPKETKNVFSGLHKIDLRKPKLLRKTIEKIDPAEIYHLAACHYSSQAPDNIKLPFTLFNSVNLLAASEIIDTIKNSNSKCRFFYASSCHIFGKPDHSPQNENTPYRPETFYSITKAAGNELCKFYREYHGVYASVGILYNHESPRRPFAFVTSQIAVAAAKASQGVEVNLTLRDLDAIVDWGAAKDYVRAMWLTLQQSLSGEYIIATGIPHSVGDFANEAFNHVGLKAQNYISQIPRNKQNHPVPYVGDISKIMKVCGWVPEIPFSRLVQDMVNEHIKKIHRRKIFSNILSQIHFIK